VFEKGEILEDLVKILSFESALGVSWRISRSSQRSSAISSCCQQALESSSSDRREFSQAGFLTVGERSLKGEVPSSIRRRLGPSGVQPALGRLLSSVDSCPSCGTNPQPSMCAFSQAPKRIDYNPGKRNPIGMCLVEFELIFLSSILM
jgi:hypothetical protein